MTKHMQAMVAAAAFSALALHTSAVVAQADPTGLWIDHTGRGAVEITQCGDAYCGNVVWVAEGVNPKGCGLQIIGDVRPIGGGVFGGGWIYDPDRDAKYSVELTPRGDQMTVLGYAGIKLLSETYQWKRAETELPRC